MLQNPVIFQYHLMLMVHHELSISAFLNPNQPLKRQKNGSKERLVRRDGDTHVSDFSRTCPKQNSNEQISATADETRGCPMCIVDVFRNSTSLHTHCI